MNTYTFTPSRDAEFIPYKKWSKRKKMWYKILFYITFKKIPKKQDGRCVTCLANEICYKVNVCKCTDDQQYELRINKI